MIANAPSKVVTYLVSNLGPVTTFTVPKLIKMLLKELKFGEFVKSNSVKSNFLTFNSLKISTPLWFLSSIGPLFRCLIVY